jgi:hypothetical protein
MEHSSFNSSKQRIKRAKAHIRNMDRLFKAFIRRKPYKLVSDPHPDGTHDILKLRAKRRRLPTSFADLSNDAVENLRAALDHATYAIAIATPTVSHERLRDIYFPFSRDKQSFAKRIRETCPGFDKEIVALLSSFQPYKGGNDILWALNEMAISSKHKTVTRMLFTIPAAHTYEISGVSNFSLPPPFDVERNEFVLGHIKRNSRSHYSAGFAYQIGFNDVPILAGKPAIGILYKMTSTVEEIVSKLEALSRKIGLFPSQ